MERNRNRGLLIVHFATYFKKNIPMCVRFTDIDMTLGFFNIINPVRFVKYKGGLRSGPFVLSISIH